MNGDVPAHKAELLVKDVCLAVRAGGSESGRWAGW